MFTLPLAVGIVMNLLMVLWVAIALLLVMIVLIVNIISRIFGKPKY